MLSSKSTAWPTWLKVTLLLLVAIVAALIYLPTQQNTVSTSTTPRPDKTGVATISKSWIGYDRSKRPALELGREISLETSSTESTKTSNEALDNELHEVINGQLSAIRAHDISQAYYGYTSKAFQQATSFEAFQEFLKTFPQLDHHESATFGGTTFDNSHVLVDVNLKRGGETTLIKYALEQQDGKWKVFGFRLMLTPEEQDKATKELKAEVTPVIQAFLNDLKNSDIAKAYHAHTSKGFQTATSFDTFGEFVKGHPQFGKQKNVKFDNGNLGPSQGTITATLQVDSSAYAVQFAVIKEDGRWKILGLEIKNAETTPTLPYFNSDDLLKVINEELSVLKQNDLPKAYYDYTSQAFQKATNFPEFEAFIKENAIFHDYKESSFNKFNFEDEIGSFEGTLTSNAGETKPVRFRLVFEDGKWKLLSIEILSKE